ncbi:MAG: hypothetical protein HQL26_01210 [Candidatus Omnitrophica bacterium]|nr:hypothetical protein [Candidatus Omnitrophota bacterium]
MGRLFKNTFIRFCNWIILVAFLSTTVFQSTGYAQISMVMPPAGTQVYLSQPYMPSIIAGLKIDRTNPLHMDFYVAKGDEKVDGLTKEEEYNKMIRYFLAALTVPDKDQWVNLSPYENNRIVPEGFGKTEMGRDLLSQDYLLKQITSSLIYPEKEIGQKFWDNVYSKVYAKYGANAQVPVNTFNKVWIVPNEATVFEQNDMVWVVGSKLKVMLEQDYMALDKNRGSMQFGLKDVEAQDVNSMSKISSDMVREIILPAIEKEVNEGKNFALLRQIYNSMILAAWYKKTLQDSFLGHAYANKGKVWGVDHADAQANQKIYDQYVKAFKVGVFNYIKEEYDPVTQQIIPRKYFSGGMRGVGSDVKVVSQAMLATLPPKDRAMISTNVTRLILMATNKNMDGVNVEFSEDGKRAVVTASPNNNEKPSRMVFSTDETEVIAELMGEYFTNKNQKLAFKEEFQELGKAIHDKLLSRLTENRVPDTYTGQVFNLAFQTVMVRYLLSNSFRINGRLIEGNELKKLFNNSLENGRINLLAEAVSETMIDVVRSGILGLEDANLAVYNGEKVSPAISQAQFAQKFAEIIAGQNSRQTEKQENETNAAWEARKNAAEQVQAAEKTAEAAYDAELEKVNSKGAEIYDLKNQIDSLQNQINNSKLGLTFAEEIVSKIQTNVNEQLSTLLNRIKTTEDRIKQMEAELADLTAKKKAGDLFADNYILNLEAEYGPLNVARRSLRDAQNQYETNALVMQLRQAEQNRLQAQKDIANKETRVTIINTRINRLQFEIDKFFSDQDLQAARSVVRTIQEHLKNATVAEAEKLENDLQDNKQRQQNLEKQYQNDIDILEQKIKAIKEAQKQSYDDEEKLFNEIGKHKKGTAEHRAAVIKFNEFMTDATSKDNDFKRQYASLVDQINHLSNVLYEFDKFGKFFSENDNLESIISFAEDSNSLLYQYFIREGYSPENFGVAVTKLVTDLKNGQKSEFVTVNKQNRKYYDVLTQWRLFVAAIKERTPQKVESPDNSAEDVTIIPFVQEAIQTIEDKDEPLDSKINLVSNLLRGYFVITPNSYSDEKYKDAVAAAVKELVQAHNALYVNVGSHSITINGVNHDVSLVLDRNVTAEEVNPLIIQMIRQRAIEGILKDVQNNALYKNATDEARDNLINTLYMFLSIILPAGSNEDTVKNALKNLCDELINNPEAQINTAENDNGHNAYPADILQSANLFLGALKNKITVMSSQNNNGQQPSSAVLVSQQTTKRFNFWGPLVKSAVSVAGVVTLAALGFFGCQIQNENATELAKRPAPASQVFTVQQQKQAKILLQKINDLKTNFKNNIGTWWDKLLKKQNPNEPSKQKIDGEGGKGTADDIFTIDQINKMIKSYDDKDRDIFIQDMHDKDGEITLPRLVDKLGLHFDGWDGTWSTLTGDQLNDLFQKIGKVRQDLGLNLHTVNVGPRIQTELFPGAIITPDVSSPSNADENADSVEPKAQQNNVASPQADKNPSSLQPVRLNPNAPLGVDANTTGSLSSIEKIALGQGSQAATARVQLGDVYKAFSDSMGAIAKQLSDEPVNNNLNGMHNAEWLGITTKLIDDSQKMLDSIGNKDAELKSYFAAINDLAIKMNIKLKKHGNGITTGITTEDLKKYQAMFDSFGKGAKAYADILKTQIKAPAQMSYAEKTAAKKYSDKIVDYFSFCTNLGTTQKPNANTLKIKIEELNPDNTEGLINGSDLYKDCMNIYQSSQKAWEHKVLQTTETGNTAIEILTILPDFVAWAAKWGSPTLSKHIYSWVTSTRIGGRWFTRKIGNILTLDFNNLVNDTRADEAMVSRQEKIAAFTAHFQEEMTRIKLEEKTIANKTDDDVQNALFKVVADLNTKKLLLKNTITGERITATNYNLVTANAPDIAKAVVEELKKTVGGIDMDSSLLNLKIKRDANGVPLKFDMQDQGMLNELPGLKPVIIDITPVNPSTLPVFMAMK